MLERGHTEGQTEEADATLVVAPGSNHALELLAEEHPQTALVVACDRSSTAVLEDCRRIVGTLEDVAVVVVGDEVRSVAGGGDVDGMLGNAVSNVARYDDTASLTSTVSTTLTALSSGGRTPTVYVDSLTAFDREVSLSRLVVTLGALTNAVGDAGGRGYFLLDPCVDDDTRHVLETVVPRTVEVDPDGRRTVVERDRHPSVSTVFDLLTRTESRYILRRLDAADGAVSVDELAEELTAACGFEDPSRAWAGLYHVHLPPLVEADVISFARDEGRIERGEAFERVRPYLRHGVE